MRQNVSLQSYSGMATPARASYLVEVRCLEELKKALLFASESQHDYLVIGEGSNTVFVDDFKGVVIVNKLPGLQILDESDESVRVKVAAGENWHHFVQLTLDRGWYGLQNLALIPGSVGASPIQNIGAYGEEVASTIEAVHIWNIESSAEEVISNAQCEFGYRESIFKHALMGKTVITSVVFSLSKKPTVNLTYPVLRESFKGQSPTPQKVFERVCEIRAAKLPLPQDIPNCGSFFKNPVVSLDHYRELKKEYPAIVAFAAPHGYKLAAAWLIEQAGWKSKSHNGIQVYRDQALVLTNPKKENGLDVLKFAKEIQKDIQKQYGVKIEIEPRLV